MGMRRCLSVLLMVTVLVSLAACATGSREVPVERADMLTAASTAADRYAGMVVSENVTKVTRDSGKNIQELYVTEGQEVKTGDKLFSYDSEALKLEESKLKLDLERMQNDDKSKTTQISDLEKQLKNTSDEATKVQINLAINTAKNEKMQLSYDISAKKQEIQQVQQTLKNVVVKSPVDGSIRKIDENGTDAYITIQKAGAYRVKGTLNELSARGGVSVGASVKIISRLDETQTWTGTVTEIDRENSQQSENSGIMYGYTADAGMTTSSSYPFYVELDDTDGLLLGQHVYIQVVSGGEIGDELIVPQTYLVNLNTDEETMERTASMWVANADGKLEERQVSLGEYNAELGGYPVLSGLEASDFVADPSASGCKAGAPVSYQRPTDFSGDVMTTDDTTPETSGDGDMPTDDGQESLPEDTGSTGNIVYGPQDDASQGAQPEVPMPTSELGAPAVVG